MEHAARKYVSWLVSRTMLIYHSFYNLYFTGFLNGEELTNLLDCLGIVGQDMALEMAVELNTMAKGARKGVSSMSGILYINWILCICFA